MTIRIIKPILLLLLGLGLCAMGATFWAVQWLQTPTATASAPLVFEINRESPPAKSPGALPRRAELSGL